MNYTSPLLAAFLAACLPAVAHAAEIKVSRADVVEPDAELRAVVADLRAVTSRARKQDIKTVEAFFAPQVRSYVRNLDPFQPWKRVDDVTAHYLVDVADVMVEQGEAAAGMAVPDYRLEAMKTMSAILADDAVFGRLPEVPGAICTPAAYKVDRKAASTFANRFERNANSLHFFGKEIALAEKPGGKAVKVVPANSLVMADDRPGLPEGWNFYESAGGIKGYASGKGDGLGLSQNHLCFAKVEGKYRITAVFGYGL